MNDDTVLKRVVYEREILCIAGDLGKPGMVGAASRNLVAC